MAAWIDTPLRRGSGKLPKWEAILCEKVIGNQAHMSCPTWAVLGSIISGTQSFEIQVMRGLINIVHGQKKPVQYMTRSS